MKGSDPEFTQARPTRKPRTSACQWCGSTSKVDASSPRRCSRCKDLEKIIAEATSYLAAHGLRPLGGSLFAESPAETDVRKRAASAQRVLNKVRKSAAAPQKQVGAKRAAIKGSPGPKTAAGLPTPSSTSGEKVRRLRAEIARVDKRITEINRQPNAHLSKRLANLNVTRQRLIEALGKHQHFRSRSTRNPG
ncbi:hypothetical protein [Rhodococcus sp. 114MFTsu3.1]|uniref:hypothetical protein n=1 Tax=Rhodococcus sp. 114MFTsu3.1 TaxID=1172184 RepID=UPI0003A97F1C|nr:hypothetical protein [Rhodococcus sp. 114MFTsu3.1]